MKNKQTPIFATQSDLSAVVREVCTMRSIQFAAAGTFDRAKPHVLDEAGELQPFTSYLVLYKGTDVALRPIPQRKGGMIFAVDQLDNPNTISLSCGGLLDGKRLIAGQIGTATASKQSYEIYALFSKAIGRMFQHIRSYYVGPEAIRLLDEGIRLTPTLKSPEAYDLKR